MTDLEDIAQSAKPYDPDTADEELAELARSLHRDNYFGPAAAIARHLTDGVSLDVAFGLRKGGRGRPLSKFTTAKDVGFLKARGDGLTVEAAAERVHMDAADARKLDAGTGPHFNNRLTRAMQVLLEERLDEQE